MLDIKTYEKVGVLQAVRCGHKERKLDGRNITERPETEAQAHGNLRCVWGHCIRKR